MINNCFICNKELGKFPYHCCSILYENNYSAYCYENMFCHYLISKNIFRAYHYDFYNLQIGNLIFKCEGFILPEKLKSLLVFA